jgi:DNA-binding NarL/FixJ family response regulator
MAAIPDGEMMGEGPRREVKLLVVDDHSDHFEQIQAFAEMYSSQCVIECKRAQDKVEAQRVMDTWEPSVVLVDVHLVSDAFNLIQEMSLKGAPVVALSEGHIPHLPETARTYGAVGCLTKSDNPDDVEQLLGYIASIAACAVVSH